MEEKKPEQKQTTWETNVHIQTLGGLLMNLHLSKSNISLQSTTSPSTTY